MTGRMQNGGGPATPGTGIIPEVPRAVDLDADTKKRVVGAVKTALSRLQEKGVVPRGDYAAVLGQTGTLHDFIVAVKTNRAVIRDLALDGRGQPVRDDTQPLDCGISLAQICQMLVFTCAKRVFTEADGGKDKAPAQEKGFLFRRKPAPPPPPGEGERKLNALKEVLAFEWQLPLLKYYYFLFDRLQLAEWGREILLFNDVEKLEVAASFDAVQIRKARKTAGEDFVLAMRTDPRTMIGLSWWDERWYPVLRQILGERIWTFLARDPEFFELVHEMDRERCEIYGPLLATISPEAIKVFQRFHMDKLRLFLTGFNRMMGSEGEHLLAEDSFARQGLLPIVQTFVQLDLEPEKFLETVDLKCAALRPTVGQWLERRRNGSAP